MKKILCLAVALLLLAGCTGCKKQQQENLPGLDVQPTAAQKAEWPADLTSLPAFTDCETIEYAGKTTNGYEIGLICSLDQLESWREQVNASGDIHGEFSVFHNGRYVVQLNESYAEGENEERLRVILYLTDIREMEWPVEMKAIPVYSGEGRAVSPLSVDSVYIEGWSLMETTVYGETKEGLQHYLEELEASGFEWVENEDGGFYRRFRDDLADQFAYEWEGDATLTLTWAILPASDAMEE